MFGKIPAKFAHAKEELLQAQKVLPESCLGSKLIWREQVALEEYCTWLKGTESFFWTKIQG